MKVLVTGAKGMLGQDLCPMLEDEGYEVIETDIKNLDITNIDMVRSVITQSSPDMVFHCAAYTNVDKAEEDRESARLVNSVGTGNIATVCAELNITLLYISTDYVFDGTKTEPYEVNDKTNPINYYGLTKLEGEEVIRKYCTKYYIVRTSWLYGHHGKNFVETMISLSDKSELKVVDDQIGCPTWTVELASGILELVDDKMPFGTYHVCGSGCTSWYDFAKEIFARMNIDVNLKPCSTEEFPRPAKRPHYSVMNNNKLCRDWKLALRDYIALRPQEALV